MTRLEAAGIDISLEAASRLIQRQFAALAPGQLEFLGAGVDNVAFRVNGRLVFRFPRHKFAADLIEREVRVLPLLAPRFPCRSLLRRSWAGPMGAIPTPSPATRCFPARRRARSPGLTRNEG